MTTHKQLCSLLFLVLLSSSLSVISGFVPRSSLTTTTTTTTTTTNGNHFASSSPLFGIKGFRAWFESQFPDSIVAIDANTNPRQSSSQEYFDHVLVDMNQILHVILRRSRNEEHAIRLLMVELDRLLQLVTPTQSLVLAIDGPPAAAKLATQRRRRYGTLVRTEWKLKHFDKLRIPKRDRAKRLRGYHSELQSLQITPATDFMQSMEATLLYWAWQRLQQRNSKMRKVKIYINPSTVPGEGEIKLLEWIFRHPLRGQSVAILGRDSDLLLEGLVIPPSWTHNVFVVREEGPKDYQCVSLWETTRKLWNQWLPPNNNNTSSSSSSPNQILQVRTDLVLLMILNGNDYLPKLRGSRGFSHICTTYMKLLRDFDSDSSEHAGLVHPDKLEFHLDFCIRFFEQIAQSQPPELWRQEFNTTTTNANTNTNAAGVVVENSRDNRRTPLGELNNIMDGGFVPRPLRFRVIKGAMKYDDDDDADGVDGVKQEEEEEYEESQVEDDKAVTNNDDVDNDDVDNDDDDDDDHDLNQQILVQLKLGETSSGDFLQYETWHDRDEPFKLAKQKLASMALDDFLGTDYTEGTDDFDVESGITNSGYSWEILHAVDGKVDKFLGGLLWNLQTYQDGICADYNYNYGRRMSPTAMDIVEFFRQAKAENRTVGRQDLLVDTFQTPVSAGLACLAALPSQVKHMIPEPYRWLPDDMVEAFYEQCMDPTDNCFDLKQFERLCEDEIAEIRKQRDETENDGEDQGHGGRRIMMGDRYWTVIGRTTEPLPHPFDPPPPPVDRLSELWPNDRIRVSRMFAADAPRPRSVWGDRPSGKRKHFKQKPGVEIIHSDLGDFLKGKQSLLDVEYKVGYEKERDAMINKKKKKGKMKFQSLKVEVKVEVKVPVADDTTVVSVADYTTVVPVADDMMVDTSSRMKQFNISMPPLDPLVNLDGQTAMACLSQLSDIGMIGPVKLTMTTPSNSEYASYDPTNYEHLHLTVKQAQNVRSVLRNDLSYDQDRDMNKQSRQALKQHLASRALGDIIEAQYRWYELSFADLTQLLMKKAKANNGGNKTEAVLAQSKESQIDEIDIDVRARMKKFNKVKPPKDPVVNLDNQTAMTCLKQLEDIGMIGQIKFTMTTPSKSDYASYSPSNYEHHHLSITLHGPDESATVLREYLEYDQDRDVNSQSRQALKQHLASLSLCDITGPQGRWSEMSFADLRSFLMKKAKSASLQPPLD